jgi:hypothetical protein
MYVKLVRREKGEVPAEFGDRYRHYMTSTPAFFPLLVAERGQGRHKKFPISDVKEQTVDITTRRAILV